MSTFAQIQKQIADLQAQATEARRKEIEEVVSRIKADIAAFGLTAADLGFKAGRAAKAAKPVAVVAPKYRDPASGKTWAGRGKPPAWIAGKDRAAFLIDAPVAAAPEVKASRKPADAVAKKAVASKAAKKAAPAKKTRKAAAA